jgi:hypothetical protein
MLGPRLFLFLPYSPKCPEHEFCEVPPSGLPLCPFQPDGRGTIRLVTLTERPQHLTLVFDGA